MRIWASLAAIGAVAVGVSVSAHHSHGQYEETFRDIEGVVKEVQLLLPHSWVYIEAADPKGGAPVLWALEATGRTGLERIGVTRAYLKAGDKIKVRCHPLRDGTHGCLLGFLKGPDGVVRDWDGGKDVPALAGF
jgi:hypothetical protein